MNDGSVKKSEEAGSARTSRNRERFIRLAEKRVTRTIRDIRLIGNLSNKSNYTYDQDEAQKIIRTLEAEIKNLRQRFEISTTSADKAFKL
jgi:transcription elongation GreA/GreB family factor